MAFMGRFTGVIRAAVAQKIIELSATTSHWIPEAGSADWTSSGLWMVPKLASASNSRLVVSTQQHWIPPGLQVSLKELSEQC